MVDVAINGCGICGLTTCSSEVGVSTPTGDPAIRSTHI